MQRQFYFKEKIFNYRDVGVEGDCIPVGVLGRAGVPFGTVNFLAAPDGTPLLKGVRVVNEDVVRLLIGIFDGVASSKSKLN